MPALHEHLLHTRHVQIVLFAAGPVAPASPLPPTSVTRGTNLPIQIQLHFTIIKHRRELRTTRVKVESTRIAVVNETSDILLTGVAVTRGISRRAGEELEGAFGVEKVADGG